MSDVENDKNKFDRRLQLFESSWKPLAAIVIPVMVAFSPIFGSFYFYDRKVDSIVIQEALAILRQPVVDAKDEAVREWAIAVIEKLSRTNFSAEARNTLKQSPGPIGNFVPRKIVDKSFIERSLESGLYEHGTRPLIENLLPELGVQEADTQKIIDYNASLSVPLGVDLPWNSQFMNWLVTKSGYTGTDSAAGFSWEKWGLDGLDDVGKPIPGCILVGWRVSRDSGFRVVGIFTGETKGNAYRIAGGNVADAVDLIWLSIDRFVTCRLPPTE